MHQQRQNGCFRDGIQRSKRAWICCCSLMKSWLIMFILQIICTRPIRRLVSQFYSSLGCFYPSGMTGRVVSSNTEIHAVKLCNSLAKWKHTVIVSYYVNLIIILIPYPILSWNLVTQMSNIIVKYPSTFQYTVWSTHCETIKKRQK